MCDSWSAAFIESCWCCGFLEMCRGDKSVNAANEEGTRSFFDVFQESQEFAGLFGPKCYCGNGLQ